MTEADFFRSPRIYELQTCSDFRRYLLVWECVEGQITGASFAVSRTVEVAADDWQSLLRACLKQACIRAYERARADDWVAEGSEYSVFEFRPVFRLVDEVIEEPPIPAPEPENPDYQAFVCALNYCEAYGKEKP